MYVPHSLGWMDPQEKVPEQQWNPRTSVSHMAHLEVSESSLKLKARQKQKQQEKRKRAPGYSHA